ncbi:hypothetical protein KKF82_04460 [Patescibacteria group bacterium]|nr:hypothetical protein [Patescibacteria group bacterium]
MEKTHSTRKQSRQKPIPKGAPDSVRRQQAKKARKKLNKGKGAPIGNADNWI